MADPGPIRPAKLESAAEPPSNGQLAELRQLLLAADRADLENLRERIRNRAQRAQDVGEVLPEAILASAARDQRLRQALEPVVEQAIAASVRKNPKILAAALFPIIGAVVRRAVASALQGMLESLNQIFESSVSFRSIGWRIEAARTGKPYAEIALLRSLLYRVEQVFLIQNETGLLLQHVISESVVARDPEMISGMLTAIQNFVQDSFGASENSLETVRLREGSVWIQQGPLASLAAVVTGTPHPRVARVFSSALETIHGAYGAELAGFNGDPASLEVVRPVLRKCLLGQSLPGRRPSQKALYAIAAVAVLAIATWSVLSIREGWKWQRYLTALQREPGVVVTHQERNGRAFSISGLRDPLARDPGELLEATGIPAAKVSARWEPYISLSPRFVALRELPALTARLQQQLIRFNTGSSAIPPDARESLRSVADLMREIAKKSRDAGEPSRFELVGHTDEEGNSDRNQQLGFERAAATKLALAALGIDAAEIAVRSAGPREPIAVQQGLRRQPDNRSVSFQVFRKGVPVQP